MTCNECGKKLPDDRVFCQFCGKRMEAKQNTPKNICKYCNKENNLNAIYCRFCGENIEKPLEIAPAFLVIILKIIIILMIYLTKRKNKMLYRQKKDTYIRNYDGVGYITSTGIFNDRMVNESGTVFLCALRREPQTLDELADKILQQFVGADKETSKKDAEEFYETLIEDGFIIKGETKEELDAKDSGFTYNTVLPKTEREDFTPTIQRADSDTQEFLEKHFKDKLHLTSFQIELTSRCNERCVHCYIPHDLKLYDITEEMYYSTLEQLSKMGVLSDTLSGGEPMCHPHFKEFLRAAKKYDFYVNILSNLTLLDDETVQIMKEGNVSSDQSSIRKSSIAVM